MKGAGGAESEEVFREKRTEQSVGMSLACSQNRTKARVAGMKSMRRRM